MLQNKRVEAKVMKKQLVILGIIALFVSIGLSGCTNNKDNKDIVTITELKLHPDSYVNKTITTIGKWSNKTAYPLVQIFNESGAFILAHLPDSDTFILTDKTEYYWTGNILKMAGTGKIYIDVIKIEPV